MHVISRKKRWKQDCQNRTLVYQNIKNLQTLIQMKTSIYSKMIAI